MDKRFDFGQWRSTFNREKRDPHERDQRDHSWGAMRLEKNIAFADVQNAQALAERKNEEVSIRAIDLE